jgi:hypothetical protein
VEADHLFRIKPFVMDTEEGKGQIGRIKLRNSLYVITTFIEEKFENIIVDGLVWSQEELDAVTELAGRCSCQLFFFWLDASKEVRFKRALSRSRDEADSEEFLASVEKNIADPRPFDTEHCCYVEVNVDEKSETGVVEIIMSHVCAE